jgi:hypothetical protein
MSAEDAMSRTTKTGVKVAVVLLGLVTSGGATLATATADVPSAASSLPLQAILRASDTQAGDSFGFAVAVSGDTAVVGAYAEDGGAGDPLSNEGAAYVFNLSLLEAFRAN